MAGCLAAQGLRVGEERVGRALRAVNGPYHELRQRVLNYITVDTI
jgi:hypothetical protein